MAAVESLVQRHSDNSLLLTQSTQLLPPGMGATLAEMMAQTQAQYPSQEMSPQTATMYLSQWEKIATRYGLETFARALSKLLDESRFLPAPIDIREGCAGLSRAQREVAEGKRVQRELQEWKEEWERERRQA
jgi:hypothetical protein